MVVTSQTSTGAPLTMIVGDLFSNSNFFVLFAHFCPSSCTSHIWQNGQSTPGQKRERKDQPVPYAALGQHYGKNEFPHSPKSTQTATAEQSEDLRRTCATQGVSIAPRRAHPLCVPERPLPLRMQYSKLISQPCMPPCSYKNRAIRSATLFYCLQFDCSKTSDAFNLMSIQFCLGSQKSGGIGIEPWQQGSSTMLNSHIEVKKAVADLMGSSLVGNHIIHRSKSKFQCQPPV